MFRGRGGQEPARGICEHVHAGGSNARHLNRVGGSNPIGPTAGPADRSLARRTARFAVRPPNGPA
ncbi:hypothetical protein BN903_122 [Halorubrum sp. AJ67]|nr:hypothetical protein BN903_122 [Halorubrum sp. AJ67]